MNPTVRNILAVILGFVIGSVVNMAIIMVSGSIIPPPAGTDATTMEGLKAALPLFEPKHFILPFLAHALGTLVGATFAAWMAARRGMQMALIVGVLFCAGGIVNVFMLPAPLWYDAVDILLAYIPMALIGAKLGARRG